jgi:hypothetical protein
MATPAQAITNQRLVPTRDAVDRRTDRHNAMAMTAKAAL